MSIEITDKTYAEIIGKNRLVVIDFWAPWCGPCKMLGPIIDELAKNNVDVYICKLNVDENPETSMMYNVTAIPSIIFIKDGQEVDRSKGAVPKNILQSKINGLKA